MFRILTSWRLLAAGFAVAVLALVALASSVERQQSERTLQQVVVDAELINELLLEPHLPHGDAPVADLAPAVEQDLDAGVRRLQREGQLVGLQLWRPDGSLLYSDSPVPDRLSPGERALLDDVLHGQPRVEFEHDEDRTEPSATILVEPEDDRDLPSGVVAEILLPQDGVTTALRASSRRLHGGAGAVVVALVTVALLARRRMLAREQEASRDPLTGLGNRKMLTAAGSAALQRHLAAPPEPGRGGPGTGCTALLLLDLDGFKVVNDTLGHAVGDELLVQVAATLRARVQPAGPTGRQGRGRAPRGPARAHGGVAIRLGGDEFAVLLTEVADAEAALRTARGISEALHRPFEVAGVTLEVGASIGVALSPQHGKDLQALLRRADVAMYHVKRAGGGVRLYEDADDPHDQEHVGTLAQLRHAIDAGQLRLHYQPKLALREQRTVGFEALVRWEHPERGLLGPDAFVPLAARTALMRPLTAWVLAEAVRQCALWHAGGWPVSVAINIAPTTLLEPTLPEQVRDLLADAGLPGSALELEITETAVMVDPVRAAHTLRRLQDVGVAVSIDDFGAGYTSLAYLKSLPVRTLKIDQSFITNLAGSAEDEAVARSVVSLGHDLGLTVVAEGVETAEVRQRLLELGCDQIQGYLLARPMTAQQVQPWLDRQRDEHPAQEPVPSLPAS